MGEHKNPYRVPEARLLTNEARIERPRHLLLVVLSLALTTFLSCAFSVIVSGGEDALVVVISSVVMLIVPVSLWLGKSWAPTVVIVLGIVSALMGIFGFYEAAGPRYADAQVFVYWGEALVSMINAVYALQYRKHAYFMRGAL